MEASCTDTNFRPYNPNRIAPAPPLPRSMHHHCNRFNLKFAISNSKQNQKHNRLSPLL